MQDTKFEYDKDEKDDRRRRAVKRAYGRAAAEAASRAGKPDAQFSGNSNAAGRTRDRRTACSLRYRRDESASTSDRQDIGTEKVVKELAGRPFCLGRFQPCCFLH